MGLKPGETLYRNSASSKTDQKVSEDARAGSPYPPHSKERIESGKSYTKQFTLATGKAKKVS